MKIKGTIVEKDLPMFLPHDLINAVVQADRLDLLVGNVDLKSFWEKFACEAVPPERAEFTVPIRLHGDDGETYKDFSASFVSIAGVANDEDGRLLCAAVPTASHAIDEEGRNLTLQGISKHLYSSFLVLQNMRPWSGQYFLSAGDLKWHKEFYGFLENNYNCNNLCFFCPVMKGIRVPKDPRNAKYISNPAQCVQV